MPFSFLLYNRSSIRLVRLWAVDQLDESPKRPRAPVPRDQRTGSNIQHNYTIPLEMALARKLGPRKSPVNRVSKPNLSDRHRSNNSLSRAIALEDLTAVTSRPSDNIIVAVMSHISALQAAPVPGMPPAEAVGDASSPGANEPTVQVWDDSLQEGRRQITTLYTTLRRYLRTAQVPDPQAARILEARAASTRSFLFYLEFDYPAERYARLKEDGIASALKVMKESRGNGVLPADIADKCAELYDTFEEENWGAQETGDDTSAEDTSAENVSPESAATASPRRRQPAVRTQGSVLERLPPADHAVWGLHGIMHGLMQAGNIRRSYRFDPRYISEKRDAKVFGHNGLTPGDWWPLVHVALFHGAHGAKIKGIAGSPDHGAWSIIVSENPKYAQLDSDDGETILYSGDDSGNKNNRDAILESSPGTKSLQKSRRMETAVRVLRRKGTGNNKYAPLVGIRYDGLYLVVEEYEKTRPGQGGKFLQFKLVRLPNQRGFQETIRSAPTLRQQSDFWKIQEGY